MSTWCLRLTTDKQLVRRYDSVTEDGRLQWQDGLTDKKSCFFAAADGIFTNYCWKCELAVREAFAAGTSVALFGPAWPYENEQELLYEAAQLRFWDLIRKSWTSRRPLPRTLPLYSTFDQGCGEAIFIGGFQVSGLPWNNLALQSLQVSVSSVL
eukprot:SM000020S06027  [mRNA]  locus=s20:576384:577603:+ [translate_table: standard]